MSAWRFVIISVVKIDLDPIQQLSRLRLDSKKSASILLNAPPPTLSPIFFTFM